VWRGYWTILALLCVPLTVEADTAEYEVRFEGIWDASHATLPFPGSAHFTTLIGDTHVAGATLWEEGELASLGVEQVAELGSTGELSDEILDRVAAGTSGGEVSVPAIFDFPSETSATFSIDSERPEISLLSMLAPSPDWFVGVSGLSLRDDVGWIAEISVDLLPYDAGTESGDDFSLSNPASSPLQPIRHRGAPFFEEAIVARLHFIRMPEPRAEAATLAGVAALAVLARIRAKFQNPAHAESSRATWPAP
jgi:hypothetical protein